MKRFGPVFVAVLLCTSLACSAVGNLSGVVSGGQDEPV